MGYWGEAGTPVTWSNPRFVPESQRQNGGWYYNPSTNRVDRWWDDGSGPRQQQRQQQRQQSQPQRSSGPSAADIIRQQQEDLRRQVDEQFNFLKEFLSKNPFAFDFAQQRKVSEEKYKPFFEEQLSDFIDPLREKINRSIEDSSRILTELVRRRELGETQKQREIETGLEKTKGGFAGRGLFGSGAARRALTQQRLGGEEELQDFITRSRMEEEEVETGAERLQEDTQDAIAKQERNIFGEGREFDRAVTEDVLGRQQQEYNKLKRRGEEAFQRRFGTAFVGNTGRRASELFNLVPA